MNRSTPFFVLIALVAAVRPAAADAVWDRSAAPGLLFRMERQETPPRNIYGLRLNPRVIRTESALAKKSVYDLEPGNGRDVLSGIVREHGALGGVNGDFFQFGKDPGGDPQNLMVRGGELLSHPVSGSRNFAAGWGPDGLLTLGAAAWEASFAVNAGPARPIQSLNARADEGEVTLHTDSAGYAYGSVEAVSARIWVGAYRLGPESSLIGTVTEVEPVQGRVRIAPGELLLTGAGSAAGAIRGLKAGDQIRVGVRVTGFDWRRVREVMGGGPVLLQEGRSVLAPGPNSFADTRHPRTALGRTPDGSLWLVVVDGRQKMSVGASLAELTEIMRRWGCTDAINLDGGGSSTMNLLGLTLNRPSAGTERPVANGVLLFGPRPAAGGQKLELRAPADPIVVGRPVQLELRRGQEVVPVSGALFAAQGAGWIDQEGRVHPLEEGWIEAAVLVDGTVVRTRLQVVSVREAK